MDFYVCTRGDREFLLTENLKYWRFRLVAIPMNPFLKINKKIMENAYNDNDPCDIYIEAFDEEMKKDLRRGFVRFLEVC